MTGAMRYAALAVVAWAALPSSVDAQIHKYYADGMTKAGWLPPHTSLHDRAWLDNVVFGDRTIWETDDNCEALKKGMERFLSNAPMYYAQRPAKDYFAETLRVELDNGDYGFIVAFLDDQTRPGDEWLNDILHEGWHWIHEDMEEGTGAKDAEGCARLRLEEDDDDPGEGGTVTTCTDEEYTYTAWEPVWTEIEAGSCVGVSPVRWPWEEGDGDEEMHCTPAKWGYVLMEVEKTGVRTVCVTTSN